jgi:hypothetical protein
VHLTEQLLGVSPVDPGYATWAIKPHPGDVSWILGTVSTRYGPIEADWLSHAPSSLFWLSAHTPTGTSGTIAVPATAKADVFVNGRIVCKHGRCGAYQAHFDDGDIVLTVPGGRYDIAVIRH